MRSPSISAIVAAAIGVAAASAAMSQIVVLEARGPSSAAYPQGAVLAPNRMIALKAGDRLEILDAAGSHVLNGPVTMPASQVDTGSKVALQEIFRRANAGRPGIAAVRGFSLDEGKAPQTPEVPPLWRLDVAAWQQAEPSDSHNFCVRKGQTPVITRAAATSESTLVIFDDASHASHSVSWSAGSRDLAWPHDIAFSDGQLFGLNLDSAGATMVRWRTIPSEATSLTAVARALLDNGCYDQLDSLQSQVAAK
jgi:hypothetical protein